MMLVSLVQEMWSQQAAIPGQPVHGLALGLLYLWWVHAPFDEPGPLTALPVSGSGVYLLTQLLSSRVVSQKDVLG